MAAEVEPILYGRVNNQESLGLAQRLEAAHAPFSHPCWLV
jgi:hypothetical protein